MATTMMGCFQGIAERDRCNKGAILRSKMSLAGTAMPSPGPPQSHTPLGKQAAFRHAQLQLKCN